MAQKVQVLLVCDLHEGDVDGTETVTFALDGSHYEIDTCADHAASLRDAFAPFVGAARRAGRGTGAPAKRATRSGKASSADAKRVQDIRDWARKNGQTVSERGRLSAAVVAAYDAAH